MELLVLKTVLDWSLLSIHAGWSRRICPLRTGRDDASLVAGPVRDGHSSCRQDSCIMVLVRVRQLVGRRVLAALQQIGENVSDCGRVKTWVLCDSKLRFLAVVLGAMIMEVMS